MLRKTPCTAWFCVNRASQSAVESSPSGQPGRGHQPARAGSDDQDVEVHNRS
jgi:hypothetical protein